MVIQASKIDFNFCLAISFMVQICSFCGSGFQPKGTLRLYFSYAKFYKDQNSTNIVSLIKLLWTDSELFNVA